ncbi:flagellar protein FlgN [Vogesella sp. LIG4]|uniref:flagellar protein FlgN n=1 Tax=Vogesella sp. LIG4 TaxID=1192162 RepID=UPI00081FF363|nr:flagellar protein FlgN [Vogesella sp. LIG4]SCK17573.1 flagella synthesis protein FlgN [Vogesella sp. LIG4]
MNPRDTAKTLLADVASDRNDYRVLEQLLEDQFAAALRHDSAAISDINQRIEVLLERLDAHRRVRPTLAARLLGSNKMVSMEAVIDFLPGVPSAALAGWWEELQHAVRRCKELNARNGRLMHSQQEIMQRVLHGESDVYVAR